MKVNILKFTIMAFMAIGMSVTSCNNSKVADKDSIYQCPMDPEITSDKPGKCSKCGMDLELIKKSDMKKPENTQAKDSTKK